MAQRQRILTYADVVDHLVSTLGGSTAPDVQQYARSAVIEAMGELTRVKRWSYYYQQRSIATSAPYSTGTVAFDLTGGAYERVLTLTSGTWPSWASYGWVVIDSIRYEVDQRKSNSQLTLTPTSNPGADVSSTTYTLYRDTYPLPIDFMSAYDISIQEHGNRLRYIHPSDWLTRQRIWSGSGLPCAYTITGDANFLGAMGIALYPPPDAAYVVSLMYQRRPRQLAVYLKNQGKASISSTAVTGVGTDWDSTMVNSVIRFSANANDPATGRGGSNPYHTERVIASVTNSAALVVDAAADTALSEVKYAISDPVDIEEGAMQTYFLRECENQLRVLKNTDPTQNQERRYQDALLRAMESDNRVYERRYAGGDSGSYVRPTYGDDVEIG